jgi:hypothetical protein
LFFIGSIIVILKIKGNIKLILETEIFKYTGLIFFLYFIINYQFGRYLFGLYIFIIFLASLGLYSIRDNRLSKLIISLITIIMLLYYFISYLLVLPYSLEITNKNNYLSRVLVRDNSSYYNFGNKFEKYISKNDLVAMHNFHGYYYADFQYIDTNYIFTKKTNSLEDLKRAGVTKLLIRSGDINWFCKKLNLTDCSKQNWNEISNYKEFPYYFLYKLN